MAKYYYCEECEGTAKKKEIDKILDHDMIGTRTTDSNFKGGTTKVAIPDEGSNEFKWSALVSREESGYYCHGKWKGTGVRYKKEWHEPKKMIGVEQNPPLGHYIGGGLIFLLGLGSVASSFLLDIIEISNVFLILSFFAIAAGLGIAYIGSRGVEKKIKKAAEKKAKHGFQTDQQEISDYQYEN